MAYGNACINSVYCSPCSILAWYVAWIAFFADTLYIRIGSIEGQHTCAPSCHNCHNWRSVRCWSSIPPMTFRNIPLTYRQYHWHLHYLFLYHWNCPQCTLSLCYHDNETSHTRKYHTRGRCDDKIEQRIGEASSVVGAMRKWVYRIEGSWRKQQNWECRML